MKKLHKAALAFITAISVPIFLTLLIPSAQAVDCLTHRLRSLLSTQTPDQVAAFEQKLAHTILNRTAPEVEHELFGLLDEFSHAHPEFPKEEFTNWWKKTPLNEADIAEAKKLNATNGNILDYRFQVFQLEKETRAAAQKVSEEVVDAVKKCGREPICSKAKVQGIFTKHFSCTLKDPRVQSSLLSSFLVSNSSYLLASEAADKPFAWDLALNNAIFSPIMVERYCRRALGKVPEPKLSIGDQYRNLFLGRKNELGARPGFLKTMSSLQWELIKFNAWWAAAYKVTNTASETLIRGKKITDQPLKDLPENERANYVSIHLGSTLEDSLRMMFFFDLPITSQRSVFISSHLYTLAMPHYIRNKTLLFTTQTGARIGLNTMSTMVFQCWKDAGQSYNSVFWDCMRKAEKENPELKVEKIATPEENRTQK